MTYIYSQGLAAAYSAVCCADTGSSAPWKLIPTASLYLSNGKTTDNCPYKKYFDIACRRIKQACAEYKNQFPEVQNMIERKELFE